jgi:hypothetical protein
MDLKITQRISHRVKMGVGENGSYFESYMGMGSGGCGKPSRDATSIATMP